MDNRNERLTPPISSLIPPDSHSSAIEVVSTSENSVYTFDQAMPNVSLTDVERTKVLFGIGKYEYPSDEVNAAQVAALLKSTVEKNHTISYKDLELRLVELGQRYNLSRDQLNILRLCANIYSERRDAVIKVRNDFQDDYELYKFMYGIYPFGKVKIVANGATLKVYCEDERDRALIYYGAYANSNVVNGVDEDRASVNHGMSVKMVDEVASIEGVYFPKVGSLRSELYGCVIMMNNDKRPSFRPTQIRRAEKHEEQHAYMGIVRRALRIWEVEHPVAAWKLFRGQGEISTAEEKIEEFPSEEFGFMPEEFQRFFLEGIFREDRKESDAIAKDEILAYCLESDTLNAPTVIRRLTKSKEDGGHYDNHPRDWKDKYVDEISRLLFASSKQDYRQLIAECVDRIFVDEYRKLIDESVWIIQLVESAGFEKDIIREVFVQVPLSLWKEKASSMLAARGTTLVRQSLLWLHQHPKVQR